MVINIIANISILVLVVYILYKADDGFPAIRVTSPQKIMAYIFFEVVVGSLLLQFPIFIFEMPYDFRFLLYALSIKYLGWQVTVPSMVILAALGGYWQAGYPMWFVMTQGITVTLMLPMLMHMIRDRMSDFHQLVVLVSFSTVVSMISAMYVLRNLRDGAILFFIMGVVAFAMIAVLYYIIYDLRNVKRMAHQDDLTHAHNRNKYEKDLKTFGKTPQQLSIAVFDVDHLKEHNDRYGHEAGDEILRTVVRKTFIRFNQLNSRVYRVGGDEFVLLVFHQPPEAVEELMTQILEDIRHRTIKVADHNLSVTLSIGLAHTAGGEPLKQTVKRADKALYKAKDAGRNNLVVAETPNTH